MYKEICEDENKIVIRFNQRSPYCFSPKLFYRIYKSLSGSFNSKTFLKYKRGCLYFAGCSLSPELVEFQLYKNFRKDQTIEIDRYPAIVGVEGDPLELALKLPKRKYRNFKKVIPVGY